MQTSLYRRLLKTFAGPTFLLLVAAGGLTYAVAKSVIDRAYDQNLINLAHGVANHLSAADGTVTLQLSKEAESVLRTDTIDEIFFRVRMATGGVLGGDVDLPPLDPDPPANSTGEGIVFPAVEALPMVSAVINLSAGQLFDTEYRGAPIRAVKLTKLVEGQTFYITVAETLHKRGQAIERLLLGFGSAAVMLLAAAALAVGFGIPSGLAPLRQLEDELGERSGTDLSPIDPDDVPREIREVVRALNGLFERLSAASRGQRQFLQDAAHQLRTPLAGLQMQLELLEARPSDDGALLRLRHSVVRVTRLANQLLALARAEAGLQLMTTAVSVDLVPLIDDMVEGWLQQADARSIDLGIERSGSMLAGDPTLLRELIANLMDNALRYTPTGGEVSLRCEQAGEVLMIEVADSGPGIPASMREQVFERFYRLPDTKLSGSGLGLPIAREIVLCHRGSIEIGDGPGGRGTLVRVRLPIAPVDKKIPPCV